jgi:hypothetical protein
MENVEFLRDLADRLPPTSADRLMEIADELEGLDNLVDEYMVIDRSKRHQDED